MVLVLLMIALPLLILTTSTIVLGLAGGRDQFDSELTHLEIKLLPNPGCPWSPTTWTCSAGTLVGPTIIQREQAVLDPAGKMLLINTEVISIEMKGAVQCVPVATLKNSLMVGLNAKVGTNDSRKSLGQIRTESFYAGAPISDTYPSPPSPKGCGKIVPPEPCTLQEPAYSFFDIFVAASVDVLPSLTVSLSSQDALRMQANITQMPPYRRPGVFLPYKAGGWVSASEAGNYEAEIHELPLKLYLNGTYCADLTGHPDHFPVGPVPTSLPDGVVINEFMPQPVSDWNKDGKADAGDEYIELYNNRSDASVDLSHWILDDVADGSRPYTIPIGTTIAPRGFLVFFRSQTGVELDDAGDTVRLLRPASPDNAVVDVFEYSDSRPDVSYSRTPDGTGSFTQGFTPTPGRANQMIRITLNEFMPQPGPSRNSDGLANDAAKNIDEYIELYNDNEFSWDLGGWMLSAAAQSRPFSDSPTYTIPAGNVIPAKGVLVFFKNRTGLDLVDKNGVVRLLRPDGFVEDKAEYPDSRPGVAYSRLPNGTGPFVTTTRPSPGMINRLLLYLPVVFKPSSGVVNRLLLYLPVVFKPSSGVVNRLLLYLPVIFKG